MKRSTTWRTVYIAWLQNPSLFKAELFIIGTNKFAKFPNKAIFENFRYNGADSYAPKVFT